MLINVCGVKSFSVGAIFRLFIVLSLLFSAHTNAFLLKTKDKQSVKEVDLSVPQKSEPVNTDKSDISVNPKTPISNSTEDAAPVGNKQQPLVQDVKALPPIDMGTYLLEVGDTVRVDVWRNPELSITVPVRPDGRISTPLVGDVYAKGITPMSLKFLISDRLRQFLREPEVSVIVIETKSGFYDQRVRLTGAVKTPMSIAYRQKMTLLDLILETGGVSDFAASHKTVIHRYAKNGDIKKIYVDLEALLEKGKIELNIDLSPGDIIVVPERLF
jgi:polysaccharide export outer membrane protein